MRGHIDVTPFRTIIADWLADREALELGMCTCGPDLEEHDFEDLDLETQAKSRADSFCEKIEWFIWQLRQQGKDVKLLKEAILFFMLNVMPRMESVEHVESALYNLIEDYLQGQDYPTRSL